MILYVQFFTSIFAPFANIFLCLLVTPSYYFFWLKRDVDDPVITVSNPLIDFYHSIPKTSCTCFLLDFHRCIRVFKREIGVVIVVLFRSIYPCYTISLQWLHHHYIICFFSYSNCPDDAWNMNRTFLNTF